LRQLLLLPIAVFLMPLLALAQMPDRQTGGPPAGYPGGAQSGPSSMPDTHAPSAMPERSKIIYVTDFELDSAAGNANPDTARAAGGAPQAIASAPPTGTSPKANASAAQAHHLVKLMSDNLLKDFAKSGYTAKLLHPNDPRPDDGFLITGIFAQVGDDNRLRRAVIGSGQIAETLQLYVAAKDLAHFTPPLYTEDPAHAASSANPGAIIEVNPNADAVRYAIEAGITDKDIKQTAQHITTDLVKRITAAAKSETDPLNRYAKP
jgi:uncharacterized protein DUF4410